MKKNNIPTETKPINGKFSLIPEKPTYPILISMDKQGCDESVEAFLKIVSKTISGVKDLYNEMKFDQPFDDSIWKAIYQGTGIINKLYTKKIKDVSDLIGISDGLISESMLNKKHPNIAAIDLRITNLPLGLNLYYAHTKGHLRPDQVINVNTFPILSNEAYEEHLLNYSHYINNDGEASIKRILDNYAVSSNNLVNCLNKHGFGQHIEGISRSYLKNFFTQTEDYHLKTDLSAPGYLANLKKS